jgi:hypothetical protein
LFGWPDDGFSLEVNPLERTRLASFEYFNKNDFETGAIFIGYINTVGRGVCCKDFNIGSNL